MCMPCTTALALRKGEKMMPSAVSCLTTCLLVSALVGIGSASAVAAQSHPSGHDRHSLVGSWLVTYDEVSCDAGRSPDGLLDSCLDAGCGRFLPGEKD